MQLHRSAALTTVETFERLIRVAGSLVIADCSALINVTAGFGNLTAVGGTVVIQKIPTSPLVGGDKAFLALLSILSLYYFVSLCSRSVDDAAFCLPGFDLMR